MTVLRSLHIGGWQRCCQPFDDTYDSVHLRVVYGEHKQRHMWLTVSTLTRKRPTKLEMRRHSCRSHLLGHELATRDSVPAKTLRHDKHDIKGNKRH